MPIPEDERPDPEAFTPMHPDCLSGPEVQRKLAAVRERTRAAGAAVVRLRQAWLPDGYSQIFRSYVIGPSGFKDYGSATLRCKI